jgi:succinate dehydrogenase / fumarate reductase flavoprotein subunit/L-aspartate oxidase
MTLVENKTYDILIIGCGGAGCAAAIEASKYTSDILLISKSSKFDTKTKRAQGGIQAAISKHDSPITHLEDTLKAGNNKGNPELVKLLTQNAAETINWLEDLGIKFDRDNQTNYNFKNAAGLSHPRVLSCGDSVGNRLVGPIFEKIESLGIQINEHTIVQNISRTDKGCFTLSISSDNQISTVQSKVIILATGGLLPAEKRAGLKLEEKSYAPDGVELALQLGAKVQNVDLIQYHPTGVIFPKELRRMRLPEPMRAYGAKFLDKNHTIFVNPLLTRNKLTQEIVKTCKEGNGVSTDDNRIGVWLTTQDIDKQNGEGFTKKHFPKFYNKFLEHGHDITKDPVLVYPIVHYSLGGVCINESSETTIENFFAAGETTFGIHGEDRLMGNSLLDIFVFGRIAGKEAGKRIQKLNN